MGIFDRLHNPIWDKVVILPESTQFIFSLIIMSYGYSRSSLKEIFIEVLDKAVSRGIQDSSGKLLQFQQISDDQKERLINNLALALIPCCKIPAEDPGNYFYDSFPTIFTERLYDLYKFDEDYKESEGIPRSCGINYYSKNPEEARTQVLVIWQKILDISDPEFNRFMNTSGFVDKWDECVHALISGMLKGANRTDRQKLILSGKNECSRINKGLRRKYEELLYLISKPNQLTRAEISRQQESQPNSGLLEKMEDGRFIIHAKPESGFGDMLSATFMILINDLPQNSKNVISRWSGLSEYQWTNDHQQMAEKALKIYLLKKNQQGKLPAKFQTIISHLEREIIDESSKGMSIEVMNIFDDLLGFI